MVKLKRRYLLVEVLSSEDHGATSNNISDTDIYHAITEQVANLYGDYGVGAIRSTFQVKVTDAATNMMVLRTSADGCPLICASLPFVIGIGPSNCVLRLIFQGASMRTVERFLIKHNLNLLYAQLRTAKTPADKSRLQEAIRSVTGSKMARIRM